jgi:hypothetical protein
MNTPPPVRACQLWDFSTFLQITLDRPAQAVWPYLFREHNDVWSRTAYTAVAGTPGEVGELYAMAYPIVSQGGKLYFEAISVQPPRHLVLKMTYQKTESAPRQVCGYDFFTLYEVAGSTTISFQQASELPVDVTANLTELTAKHHRFLDDIFQDLKKMVEGTPLGDRNNPWNA